MSTLMGAVETLRSRDLLPSAPSTRVRDLIERFQPGNPSVRALLLRMLGIVSVKAPWAIIFCRFKGSPPNPILEDPIKKLFTDIFTAGTGGLVEYWRDASLDAIDISASRVFDWVEVEISREKAGGTPQTQPPGPGRAGLIDFAIRAAQRRGDDPLTGFHSQIAVYAYNWSKDGAPMGADWSTPGWAPFWIDGSADGSGRVCLTPPFNGNVTAHEMGHGFGMNHDLASDLKTDYGDPSCIMSQNGPFIHPAWNVAFGPAICLPHLMQRNWMYSRRVYYDSGGWMGQSQGITVVLAPISRPSARANLGVRLAFQGWDYYLEYMIPTEWNRGVPGAPYLFVRRMVGDRTAYLGAVQLSNSVGDTRQFIEPSGNVRFQAKLTGLHGPIIEVNATKL